ncbi:MAG TPA: NAD(P)H-binding protein, partial [Candidatus Lokiarchaeia archaeon]
MKEKKLAVIGANGFLGKHTIQRAIKKGWKVIGIVRRDEAAREIESLGAQSYIFKEFKEENLSKAFKGCKAVIHFANVVCGSLEIFRRVNVEGTQAVVKAAEQSKISRIIYPSGLGTGEYGKIEWANNEYFRSKKLSEEIIQKGKVPFVIFRPSYILGPND